MRISVLVKPGRKNVKIEWDNEILVTSLNAPAREGKANKQLIEVMANFFNVTKTSIIIVSGYNARRKRLEIKISPNEFEDRILFITKLKNTNLL